jgi:hypothetical protein
VEEVASSKSSISSSMVRPWEHNLQVAIIAEVFGLRLFVVSDIVLLKKIKFHD